MGSTYLPLVGSYDKERLNNFFQKYRLLLGVEDTADVKQ